MLSIARSAALRRAGIVFRRQSTAIQIPEGSEAEFDKTLESLNIPEGYPIITPYADKIHVRATQDIQEFADHVGEQRVYVTDIQDDYKTSPYQDLLGIDYHKKLTIGSMVVLTALSKEWYIMNEETVIAACFGGFVTTLYAMLAQPMSSWYYNIRDTELREQNEAEDAHIAACKNVVYGFPADAIQGDLDAVFDEEKKAIESEARARVVAQKNEVLKSFDSKLAKMVITKQEAANKAYQLLLNETVLKTQEAASDTEFKKTALQYAVDAALGKKVDAENPTIGLYDKVFKDLGGK